MEMFTASLHDRHPTETARLRGARLPAHLLANLSQTVARSRRRCWVNNHGSEHTARKPMRVGRSGLVAKYAGFALPGCVRRR
jgi:hypothetical protein